MKAIAINYSGRPENFAMDDRGLAYGDGVFETILVHSGEPVWWQEHWQRLQQGARVLQIPAPDETIVLPVCEDLFRNSSRSVLKIILTRGSGGRGYLVPEHAEPRIIVSLHEAPAACGKPVNLRWCKTRLACQPLLAGIKHLNRLEQVLARNEWQDKVFFDGVMRDNSGNVICTTSANFFAKVDGLWLTPKVDEAGIAGIARRWVLGQWPNVREAHLSRPDVEQAEAIFICNAVRGILPVSRLEDKIFPEVHRDILDLQNRLKNQQPGFAEGERGGS